jgi:hypothetical protein
LGGEGSGDYYILSGKLFSIYPLINRDKDDKNSFSQKTNYNGPVPPFPPKVSGPLVGNMLGTGCIFFNTKCVNGKSISNINAKYIMILKSFDYTMHL